MFFSVVLSVFFVANLSPTPKTTSSAPRRPVLFQNNIPLRPDPVLDSRNHGQAFLRDKFNGSVQETCVRTY